MGDAALQHRTYQRAAEIADLLLAAGLPVVGFQDFDAGHAIGIAFSMPDGRRDWAARLPVPEATVERFRELYEAEL